MEEMQAILDDLNRNECRNLNLSLLDAANEARLHQQQLHGVTREDFERFLGELVDAALPANQSVESVSINWSFLGVLLIERETTLMSRLGELPTVKELSIVGFGTSLDARQVLALEGLCAFLSNATQLESLNIGDMGSIYVSSDGFGREAFRQEREFHQFTGLVGRRMSLRRLCLSNLRFSGGKPYDLTFLFHTIAELPNINIFHLSIRLPRLRYQRHSLVYTGTFDMFIAAHPWQEIRLRNVGLTKEHCGILCKHLTTCETLTLLDVFENPRMGTQGRKLLCDLVQHNPFLVQVKMDPDPYDSSIPASIARDVHRNQAGRSRMNNASFRQWVDYLNRLSQPLQVSAGNLYLWLYFPVSDISLDAVYITVLENPQIFENVCINAS